MCGIAGYIDKRKNIVSKEKVKKMTDAIQHRGPDAEGQWIFQNVALGHRRLAIIDLDKRSSQPLMSHDGKYMITYNGEIYNYVEMKEELEQRGAHFKTSSDTEVIMEAYRYYGISCLERFNGMWAFCLYDIEKNKLLFCRDRFGVKPLYILDREDVFAFASEIKGIIAAFPEENIPNEVALLRYLSGSVNENQDEISYYKNVKIFSEAHYMIYDLHTNQISYQAYWQVDEKKFYKKWIEKKNPISTFKSLFESAVSLRLRADVEVGACLSGGLDSSAIVGCATKHCGQRLHTFSSVYSDKECDEKKYAQAVNKKFDTEAHYICPDEKENEFTKYIERIIYHHDGPVRSASLYSQYMVMDGVHKHVKVVLDGQGADELFAGYIPYYSHYISDLINRGDLVSKLKAVKLLIIIKREWSEIIGAISTDMIVKLVGIHNIDFFLSEKNGAKERLRRSKSMFTKEFLEKSHDQYNRKDIILSSDLNTRLCNDVVSNSIPALLHNEDSNSMAFSIESRIPFLDYRIVEFAFALDEKYKIKNQWTKWIIRKSCRSYLPKKVRKRKNKMGFPAPFSRWLREGKSKEEIKEVIYSFGKRNIVPFDTIKAFYEAHEQHNVDLSDILFRYYSAELWLRTCD